MGNIPIVSLDNYSKGKYPLQIRAITGEGSKNIITKSLLVVVDEYFYKTNLFYGLVFMLFFLLTVFYLLLFIRRNRKIAEVRRLIAQDLHDEVGAYLTGISMNIELMKKSRSLENNYFQTIELLGKNALLSLKDSLWSLNSKSDNARELWDRVKTLARETLDPLDIHFSFKDAAGTPVMHDPADPLGLSPVARAFAAGILHHQPALCALTAPSTISYIRLRPNRWAPTHATLEQQDRGAALRICPVLPGPNVAKQFNVEYRVADGAASPYLALAAVVWAGVDGIRRGLAIPEEGPALPASLEQALDALEASEAARGWMGESFHGAYLMHKRGEAAMMAGLTEAEQCARYADTY
jgi:hypothetical protein